MTTRASYREDVITDRAEKKMKNDHMEKIEYRAVIKHLKARGLTGSKIYQELRQTMGDKCPARSTVFRWINEFKNGRNSVTHENGGGRPKTASSAEKIDQIRSMILANRRITIADIGNTLNISRSSVNTIVHKKLNMFYDTESSKWKSNDPQLKYENDAASDSDDRTKLTGPCRIVRSQILPHMCQYCGRGFSTTAGLNEHLTIHTDERAFKCPTCSREFRRKSDLRHHKKTHMAVRIKKYECSHCGKRFAERRQLIIHERIHVRNNSFNNFSS